MKPLTLIEKAFLLKRTNPFSSLDLDLLLTIADKLVLVQFEKEEQIFVSGEEANRMYFIVKGQIKLTENSLDHSQSFLLENGNFFGEESLFSNLNRGYSAIAVTDVHVLTLSRTNLYAIISECPSVAVGFLHVYTTAHTLGPLKGRESSQ